MRTLQRAGLLSGLGRAVAEVGRVEKTLYLLAYVRDETYRRHILVQLTGTKAGTPWHEPSSTVTKASCASAIVRAWKIS